VELRREGAHIVDFEAAVTQDGEVDHDLARTGVLSLAHGERNTGGSLRVTVWAWPSISGLTSPWLNVVDIAVQSTVNSYALFASLHMDVSLVIYEQ